MKPLLYIAVTLSLGWVAHGAPQPLSLVNITTLSDLNLTMVPVSETHISEDDQIFTSPQPTEDKDVLTESNVAVSVTGMESSSESAEAREENDNTATIFGNVKEETLSTVFNNEPSTEEENISTEAAEAKSSLATESTDLKMTENEEGSKNEEPMLRYVPPLDPMKHMFMMADIKNIPRVTSHVEKINVISIPSTTEVPVSVDTSSESEEVSSESSDIMEKVAESSEVEEKHEPVVAEITVGDNISTELIMKPEEISSETDEETEASSISTITDSLPMTVSSIRDTTVDFTERPLEVEETLAILKNSEEILNAEDSTVKSEENPESNSENETTPPTFSSTEETIKVSEESVKEEDLTIADTLLKNAEDIKFETTFEEHETTTFKSASTTLKETELKSTDISTKADVISTTSTTVVPETTFESSSTIHPKIEKENLDFIDELEFRSVKTPILNESKVAYVVRKPIVSRDPEIIEVNSPTSDETEATTSNILTTIANTLLSFTSTTESPDELVTKSDSEPTSEENPQTSILPLSVDKDDMLDNVDSGVILLKDPADMLKVQPIKSGLNSIPAKEATTNISFTETTDSEHELESLTDDASQTEKELEPQIENIETTSESTIETTKIPTTTTEDISPKANPTTIASIFVAESDTEDSTETGIKRQSNKPAVQNDPSADEKSLDYLLNVKDRYVSGDNKDMVAAVQFLHYHDKASSEQCFKLVDAHWNYATNLTEDNKKKQLEQTLEYSLFHKEAWKNATSFAWKSFNDTLLRRWFKSLSVLGTAALPEDKLNEFNKLKAEMKNTYSTAKVCVYVTPEAAKKGKILTEKDCNLSLEPDLQRTLTKSRDYDELIHVWKSWRDAAGKPIREKYLRFVNLSNEAARLNGFSDTGDMWREAYESETFETDLEELWEQLRPLYEHLHAYVRRRLITQYGSDKIKSDGPIPAHVFGNMWAQSWVSLLDITQPFPGKPSVDVTPIMEAKNMSAYEMFKISEEFFTSLGLKEMPEPFWKRSLIEKPKDREIICHASAWDFCNGKDYRIKQCTDITMEDLITVHHEMGHIQYFLQYARQPNVFREGANPGFHEAIGDVLALSVSTPKHLQSIGLLDEVADDPEGDLNFLLYTALDKVSFLPSGYLIDLWRWGLFSGDIKPEEMNSKWWELRLKYQGICPPVKRTDTDFDPGAKFHVPGNVPYIRYFVSFVIQFQFHKVLCDAAGHTGPLYKCDIYRSNEAGQILSQVMELGSSEHWSEAMKIMTGGATNKMDAGPILEYFEPLLEFLMEQNKNETLGWQSEDATICP